MTAPVSRAHDTPPTSYAALLKEAAEALEPFGMWAEAVGAVQAADDYNLQGRMNAAQFRRARAALAKLKEALE